VIGWSKGDWNGELEVGKKNGLKYHYPLHQSLFKLSWIVMILIFFAFLNRLSLSIYSL